MLRSDTMTRQEVCRLFDHTNLKAFADRRAFEKLCEEARGMGCAMVAVNSAPVKLCKELLAGTAVHVGAAISFPLGQTTVKSKVFETVDAVDNGADEIDYVINVGELKSGNPAYIRREMEELVAVCHSRGVLIKVIFENCYLTKEEIRAVAEIAAEAGPDFIKTSTGFGTSGACVEDIRIMKETVGDRIKVKAAGGISSWETCKALIDAGAERIGTSSSLNILREYDACH